MSTIKVYTGSYYKDDLLRIAIEYRESPKENKYFLLSRSEATILANLLLEEVKKA